MVILYCLAFGNVWRRDGDLPADQLECDCGDPGPTRHALGLDLPRRTRGGGPRSQVHHFTSLIALF